MKLNMGIEYHRTSGTSLPGGIPGVGWAVALQLSALMSTVRCQAVFKNHFLSFTLCLNPLKFKLYPLLKYHYTVQEKNTTRWCPVIARMMFSFLFEPQGSLRIEGYDQRKIRGNCGL